MIKVEFYYNSSKILCGFQISGHSGYSEYGSDIVCAGVSALAINTVNSIKKLTYDTIEVKYEDEGGFLKCILPESARTNVTKETLLLLQALELGITNIQRDYKKYIHISYREV